MESKYVYSDGLRRCSVCRSFTPTLIRRDGVYEPRICDGCRERGRLDKVIEKVKTPVYKMTILVTEFGDKNNPLDVLNLVRDIKYLAVSVEKAELRDAGEWDDDHPLNHCEIDRVGYFDSLPKIEGGTLEI